MLKPSPETYPTLPSLSKLTPYPSSFIIPGVSEL